MCRNPELQVIRITAHSFTETYLPETDTTYMPTPVRPKKALGQHFLTDMDVARRIAGTISADAVGSSYASLPVIEVGPGTGVLTQFLIPRHPQLTAIELDGESVEYLAHAYPQLPVVADDFLRLDLREIYPGQFMVIGNYPYNISSQIFFKVLDLREHIPVVAGMLQREVAQRICAAPGSKVYGILSVLLQAWYDCEYLFTVDENVFAPPPKVKSGVIRLTRNTRTALGCDERKFKTVVKTSFGMRRKTLRNSLAGLMSPGSTLSGDPILQKRPEQLSVEEFIDITNRL